MRIQESSWAKCPFYKGHTHQVIHCEGAVARAATHLAFATPDGQKDHRAHFCERMAYDNCPVAKMLAEKYE